MNSHVHPVDLSLPPQPLFLHQLRLRQLPQLQFLCLQLQHQLPRLLFLCLLLKLLLHLVCHGKDNVLITVNAARTIAKGMEVAVREAALG